MALKWFPPESPQFDSILECPRPSEACPLHVAVPSGQCVLDFKRSAREQVLELTREGSVQRRPRACT